MLEIFETVVFNSRKKYCLVIVNRQPGMAANVLVIDLQIERLISGMQRFFVYSRGYY